MALGKLHTDTDIEPERVHVRFGDIALYPQRQTPELLDRAGAYLGDDQIVIGVDLGIAIGQFTAYGCDLTEGYVRINADYTT
jgi:glutamate N-acetyltransferase/amino-acid N-acetyltransferase